MKVNRRLANLAGYIVCQQTNDGSKFFQTTNMKKNTAEQKEYIDTAVSMIEKAQKIFGCMRGFVCMIQTMKLLIRKQI